MINVNNVNDLIGAAVHDSDDKKIGTVGQVYVDSDNQTPTWVTIKTGLFGSGETFAPLNDATYGDDVVRVSFEKEFVKDAPRVDDDGTLSTAEEDELYRYYGMGGAAPVETPVVDQDVDRTEVDRTEVDRPTEGHDTSGPTTDDAMTRSEERLQVGTETVETGRVRLRKHVVTEMVTKTVPVSHEEVTLEREPITDANIGDATSGPELSSEEHEIVLTGERVVTDKETVPVERVALGTQTVTEQENVTEDVSHEEIELLQPETVQPETGQPETDRSNH
ncbi:MAG: hypothetical protein RI885_2787 [Actinomycetota bacterium]